MYTASQGARVPSSRPTQRAAASSGAPRDVHLSQRKAPHTACHCEQLSSGAALVHWARSDGAFVSAALSVNATSDGLRGVVATRDVAVGETLLSIPPQCTAFSAVTARAELFAGLGATLQAIDATGDAPGDEAVLAAWLCLALVSTPGACALRAYARALPQSTPDLPALWPAEIAEELLPWWMLDAVDESRLSFAESLQSAASITARSPGEKPSIERLQWAVAHVRARAVRYQVRTADGRSMTWAKCMMPIVDTQNHEQEWLDADVVPILMKAGVSEGDAAAITGSKTTRGPATRVEFSGGGASWVSQRPIPSGSHVTWSYGPLSNEQCLLQFGFVPTPSLHADCLVELTIPEAVIIDALARCPADTASVDSKRRNLLFAAGALGMQEGEQALFEVRPCAAPEALMAVCGAIALRTEADTQMYEACTDAGGEPAGQQHASRARALACSVLTSAAQQWCGQRPKQDEPCDRAAAATAIWDAAQRTLATAAVAARTARVPPLQPV